MASWQHHWLSGWEEGTMALTNPTVVGTVTPGSVSHASDTITTSANIPAGATVVLVWAANASRTPTSFTGTSGLSFQQDAGQALAAGSGGSGWIYSAKAASLISAGATVIVNFATGTIATAGTLMYFEGADTSAWFDVGTMNASAGSTAWDTGTTATRAQANEISVAMAFDTGSGATTNTVDAPATELNEITSGGRTLVAAYEQHTSTGTSLIQGDWDTSQPWNAAIATYKEAAAGGGAVALDGTSAGTSTDTGSLNATFALGATSAGTSSTTGSAVATWALTGTSAGTSATTGDLTVQAGGQIALTGTSAGTSSTTGALRATFALTGTSAGLSTTTGSARMTWALAGASAGTSTTTGNLAAGRWQPHTDTRWPLLTETRW